MIVKLLADDELGRLREDTGPPPNPKYKEAFAAIDDDPNQFLTVAEWWAPGTQTPINHIAH